MAEATNRLVCDSDLLNRLRSIFSLDEPTIARQLHTDFNRYFKHMLHAPAAFDIYFDEIRYIARIGAFSGHVLELAAGFGVTAICFRSLGIERITCIDLVETKVSTARKLADLVQVDGVNFQLGDAINISSEDNSFDGVLIKDAASHFRYPSSVYAEVARVLRPGGRLVIHDDRNALNSRVRSATQQIWETSETGSPDELARLGIQMSFTQMRREYILRRFPDLDERTANRIANQTRGYTYNMLDQVVPSVLEGKSIELEPVAPCINPENEIVQERLIDPLKLAQQLRQFGFSARVVPPIQWDPENWRRRGGTWKGFLRQRLMRLLGPNQRIWPVLIKQMSPFIVAAVKR
jgi:ubiquinone/menaquinone biosynthesis C-methylase UbiE